MKRKRKKAHFNFGYGVQGKAQEDKWNLQQFTGSADCQELPTGPLKCSSYEGICVGRG